MIRSKTRISTMHAQRYLDQVYKHARYRTEATLEGSYAVVISHGLVLIANAQTDALTVELTSSSAEALERAQKDLKTFLEHWGEGDALVVDWEPIVFAA